MVKEMSKGLLSEWWDEHKQPGGPKGWKMDNASGVSFYPDTWDEGHERETKAMAWFLQGLEAAFIHSLTILSKARPFDVAYGFKVVANEHDGLITDGEIPGVAGEEESEIVERAREMSGFHRAELKEKPFADEDEIEEVFREEEPQSDPPTEPDASPEGQEWAEHVAPASGPDAPDFTPEDPEWIEQVAPASGPDAPDDEIKCRNPRPAAPNEAKREQSTPGRAVEHTRRRGAQRPRVRGEKQEEKEENPFPCEPTRLPDRKEEYSDDNPYSPGTVAADIWEEDPSFSLEGSRGQRPGKDLDRSGKNSDHEEDESIE
jgi:hypothetical protein